MELSPQTLQLSYISYQFCNDLYFWSMIRKMSTGRPVNIVCLPVQIFVGLTKRKLTNKRHRGWSIIHDILLRCMHRFCCHLCNLDMAWQSARYNSITVVSASPICIAISQLLPCLHCFNDISDAKCQTRGFRLWWAWQHCLQVKSALSWKYYICITSWHTCSSKEKDDYNNSQ